MTLHQWFKSVASNSFDPVKASRLMWRIWYVPDCRAIEHQRTQLWDLEDYRVTAVTGGSIVLVPKA